jgi:hypothetical protein
MEYIHTSRGNRIHEWCYSKYREISVNLSKTWKNVKRNLFTIKVSVIKIDNDFNHRNFYRVSEPLKFRRYLYFRQVVRSSKCPFGKMSFGKMSFGKVSFGKMSSHQMWYTLKSGEKNADFRVYHIYTQRIYTTKRQTWSKSRLIGH